MIDFGLAIDLEKNDGQDTSTIGETISYMSPELRNKLDKIDNETPINAYKSDVYSLGCIILRMIGV